MDIPKNSSAAVVVNREWANLAGIRMFLRHYDMPEKEIGGSDNSHLILAKVLDSDDPRGLWIELFTEVHKQAPTAKRLSLLVPWNQVLSVVLTEEWTPALRKQMKKVGF